MPRTLTGSIGRQARQHFLGGLVGEGHGQDAARRDLAGLQQPGDARGQHPRLAGARPRENQRVRGGKVTAASCSGLRFCKSGDVGATTENILIVESPDETVCSPPFSPGIHVGLMAALVALAAGQARAQSFCASDGQPRPAQLLERFINANCESCWADPATPKAARRPARAGLGAARRQGRGGAAVGRGRPRGPGPPRGAAPEPARAKPGQHSGRSAGLKGATLRVAHGLPLSGYLGTSIELKPIPAAAKGRQWTAWLALVETLPAGTEGSPVERNLVRNVLQTPWDGRKPLAKGAPNHFFDARSMSIAQGANPERMRVLGWVEDDKGRVLAAAQSRCTPQK